MGPKILAQNRPSRSGVKVGWLMVSGFFTSPKDHERIFSGDAMPIRMASKCSSGVNCLNRSSRDFIYLPNQLGTELKICPQIHLIDYERSSSMSMPKERISL